MALRKLAGPDVSVVFRLDPPAIVMTKTVRYEFSRHTDDALLRDFLRSF